MKYCAECVDLRVAIKGVWLLFVRGRWRELSELGVKRSSALQKFRDTHVFGPGGKLKSSYQVRLLLKAHPPVLDGAVRLLGVYMKEWGSEMPQIDKEFERKEREKIENISR